MASTKQQSAKPKQDETDKPETTTPQERPPSHQEDPLLTLSEVARYIGKSRPTIVRWCRDGLLKTERIGHKEHIRQSVLDTFLGGTAFFLNETN